MIQQNKNIKTYKIGIDARFFGLENKGLGRYTNELVEWIDKLIIEESQSITSKFEYYIFLKKENFDNYQPLSKNIYKIKADYQWYSWQEQLVFPFFLNKYNLNLVHFPHFNVPILYKFLKIFSKKNKFIVTIHDLILFHYPTIKNTTLSKLFYFFKLMGYHLVIRIVAWQANQIIAISKFTKKDIIKSLRVRPDKIKVIYEGAEFSEHKIKSGKNIAKVNQVYRNTIFKKYGILNKYILYVGNAYPHKNLERLVLAFDAVKIKNKETLQLVLVGRNDYFYKKLEKFIIKNNIKNVIITDYISDQELEELYRQTELFVFPSLYEGFGLPPLEALIKGIPVISSPKSSLFEILGDKVKYFNPEDVNSIKNKIENALLSKKNSLTAKEIEQIKSKHNWRTMTKQILEIYKFYS